LFQESPAQAANIKLNNAAESALIMEDPATTLSWCCTVNGNMACILTTVSEQSIVIWDPTSPAGPICWLGPVDTVWIPIDGLGINNIVWGLVPGFFPGDRFSGTLGPVSFRPVA
jgi:hypothetical protein